MPRVASVAVVVGVALSAACSLITSLDDLRGGTDGAADVVANDADAGIVCEAGLTACKGTCLDTTLEPTSCGACGHDCLGQPCANGLCAPVTLAQVGGSPHGIAVDDQAVYFTAYDATGTDGGVFRVGTDGGGLSQIAGGQFYPSIIALADGGGMYWTNAGYGAGPSSIMYAERDGGSPVSVTPASGTAFGLTTSGSSLYWTNSDKAGSIETASLDGGSRTTIVPSRNTPSQLTTDGTSLFWAEQSGSVVKSGLDGSNVVTLVGNLSSVFGIAIDATDVYFTDQTLGIVAKISKNQGPVTKLATGQEDARCVAVSAGDVAWAAYANGAVRGYVGGQPREYAVNQNAPLCVAFDATWIYWTDYGDGTVKKTPR